MKIERLLTVMHEAAREQTDELRLVDVATVTIDSEAGE